MKKNSMRLLGFLLVAVMMVSLLAVVAFAGDTVNDVNETASQTSETLTWKDGDVIDGITISKDVTINVSGTVTVNGTIRLAPDAICNVVFNGSENAKLIRGEGFTGQMFYAEGTSDNFQKLTFNNITLDGGAVWTGDVDKTLNRGTTNAGVKATGSLLFLMRADAVLNNSVLQNHDDSTDGMTNAVCLRYYSSFTVNDSIVRNNNSIATYFRGGVVTIRQGGTVKTNNADVYGNSGPAGGFVGISSTGSYGGIAEVKDSKFHNNYADNGAVFLMQCNAKIGYLSIEGCEFYENASKTAVLTEWAYSRPFIIKDSYFHDNECAVWDCHADPVLDLSGKIVVEEDADYTKYLFETPLVLGGALTDGSSIAISEASLTKLLSTKAYVVTGTADYAITDTDLAKFVLPEGYKFLVADVNFDGIMDAVPVDVDFVVSQVTVTLKDSLDADASETRTVIAGLAYNYGTPSAYTGFAFTGWQKDDGKAVNAPIAVTSDSILTAQWKLANPSVAVSVNGATLTATISNANEDIAYTYQWYIDGTAIDGATADTYTMTDLASHKYRCTVTASYEGYKSTSGKKEVTASVPAAAQIGDVKYETLAEAIAAANAADGATTVTLLADVALSEKLTITGDVTIEGAYTITRANTGTLFAVEAGATLTLDGGLTIDGGNNWAYTVFPPVMDLENGSGTKVADHITPAEGGVNATAHMIVNNGTLNVHSATIENSYSTGGFSLINAGANSVTILDGATIRHTAANRSGAVANIGGSDAILTIKGTTRITDNFGIGNGGIIQNYGQGTTVNLEGGSIDNNFVGSSGTLYASYSSNANKINTFNMTGGIITENVMEGYGPVYIHTNTVWNMSGGEISENVSYLPSYVRNNNPAGTMTGGKIVNNEIAGLDYSGGYYLTHPDLRLNGKTAITGGVYSQNVFEYVAPNTGVAYDDGLYTVVSEGLYKLHLTDPVTGEPATIPYLEGNVLASLVATGKLFYADYYEMTLEVLYDVKVDETVVIDYPMTIDLNGHTITGYSTMQTTPVFRVVSDVTVIGEGKVDGRPGSACYAFIVGQGENAGNLTIENGTFYGDTSAISVTKGTATINGGKFAVNPYQKEGEEDNYNFLLNCIDANYKDGSAKIIVKGGTFYKFNPAANAAEGANTSFVHEDYLVETNGDYYSVRLNKDALPTIADIVIKTEDGETVTLKYPSERFDSIQHLIGTNDYADFVLGADQNEMLASVANGNVTEIVMNLYENIALDAPLSFYNKYFQIPVEYAITVNGNGHTISWADGYNGTLINVENGVDVTLKDLTIDGENSFTFYDDTTTVENGQNWYTRFVDVGEEDKAINDNVIVNAGNLTLDSVRITGVTIASDGPNGKTENTESGYILKYNDDLALIKSNGGKVTINGGAIMYNAGMVLNAINAETSLNTNVMYNMGVGNKGGIIIANGGTMDIKGVITYNKAMARSATILGVINGAEVTFNAVMNYNEHIGVGSNTAGAMIVLEGASQFVMNGGTINYNEGGRAGAIASRWVSDEDISIVLNAGSIIGNTASNDSWNGASIFLRSPATIGEGMTIDGTIAVNAAPGALEITGGTFNNFDMIVTDGLTAEITGGTFDNDPTEWVAEGYEATDNGDGTFTVRKAVAKIGDVYYATLQDAIDKAEPGDTITFLADITEDVTVNKSVTIDGADFTFTGKMTLKADTTIKNVNFDGKGYNGYAVETRGADYLTIEDCTAKNYGYGFVQLASGTALTTVKNVTVSNMNYGVKVDYSNAVVLENVKIDAAVAALLNSNYGSKTITIKNSELSILGTWERNDTIKTTYVFEGANAIDEFITVAAIDSFKLAAGATLTAPEGYGVTTDVAGMKVVYENGTYKLAVLTYVAQIGDTKYETLQDAIDKAEPGDEIIVLENINIADQAIQTLGGKYNTLFLVEGKAVTVNLNGKTISGAYNGDSMLVGVFSTDKNGKLTLTGNGTVNVTATNKVYSLIVAYSDGSSIVIENGTYKLDKASDNLIYYGGYTDAAVTVKGGTFELGNVGTGENGMPWIFNVLGAGDHHVLITGGTFNADINRQHWSNEAVVDKTCYVVNNGDGTWTVKAGAAAHVHTGMTTGPYYAPKEIGYATIEEAIAAAIAEKDDPITLLTDFVLTAPIDAAGKTLVQNGFAIKLATVDASLTAAEGLNVTTDLEGYEVVYEDGTYKVSQIVIAEIFFSAFGGIETSVTYPGYANSLQELVDYYMFCNNANEIAIPGLSAGDYTPVLVIYGGLSAEDVAYLGGASTDGTYVSAKPMTWTVRFANGVDASNNIKAADGYVVLTNDDGTLTVTKILASITFEFLGTTEYFTYPGYADGDEPIRSMHDLIDVYLTHVIDRFGMYPEDPTITLHSDIALDETFLIDAQMPLGGEYDYDLTLDLNGYTITSSVTPAIRIVDDLDVTVKNGTMDTDSYCFILGASDGSSAGNLTIESGSYTGTTSVVSVTKGTLTVLGGEFKTAESSYGATYMLNCIDANYKDGSASIIVKGGRFYGFNPEDNAAEGAGTNFVPMGYRASIYGTIDGVDVYDVVELKATVEAGGITYYFPGVENVDNVQELANFYFLMQKAMGWFSGYDYEPVLTLYAELTDEVVLGNTPSDDTTVTLPETVTWTIVTNGFDADLIKAAEGYVKIDNGDGTITIRKAVAKVGDTYFATLQDAFAACTNGETITLLVDLVYDADDVVPAHGGATGFGKYDQYNPSIVYIGGTKGATDAENQPSNVNAVLDLNGHTITNNADAYLFLFMDNCKVTIKDSKDGDGIIGNTEAPVIWVTGTDTLVTIENGKYTTANAEGLLWSTHGGDLVIKGGEFSTSADDASLLIVRNAEDRRNPNYFVDGKATVTIYGGTYYGFDPEKTMDDSTDPFTVFDACADGYKAIDNGDGSYTVKKCVVTIGSVEDLLAFGNAVTNNTLYQGVKVAANPDVIVLLTADLNLTDSGFVPMGNGAANAFSGTFDGQDHTISNMTLSCNYYRGVGFFRSLGNGATIKNLTFVNADVNNGAATSANHFYGVVAGFSYNVTLDNVDIRDSKVTCKYAGSAMIGCLEGASTIKNCDIENVILNTTNIRGAVYGILGNSVNGHSATLENNTVHNVVFIVDGEIKAIKETLKYNEWADGTEYTESMYVAQIGETKYTTLADAIAAAKDGDTVTLIGNVIRASTLVVDKDVTIDFNGHTVYGSKFIQNAPVLRILAEVTVKNGAVDGRDGFSCYAFIVGNSDTAGSLTIVDGKYYGDVSVVSVTKGTLTIEGGYFEATEYNGAHEFTLNCIDANYKDGTASIVVKGGTFYKFNPENNAAEGAGTDFVPETHISVDNGDDTYTVINYIQWIKAQLLAGNDVTLDRDVVVNSDYTTSEDCQANGFGQYKNWGIFTVINGDVTFDLNGHNVTYTGHSENFCNKVAEALFYANNGAKLTIVDSSADKTGSVDVYGMATAVYSTGVGSVATVKGGTWNGYGCPECGAFNIFLYASHGGELYIEDGYFSQNGLEDSSLGSILIVEHSGAVKNLDALVDYSQTKVEITGGTFVGMDPEQAVEGYQKTWSSTVWGNTNVVAEGKMSYEVEENVWIIISADIVVKLETEGSDEVKFFSSIAEAMAEARLTAGNDTIYLLKDHTESIVLVYDGTILNVEDKTLTADYLVVFKGGFLTGNAYDKDGAHGQVKIDKDRVVITEGSLPQGQGYILPVWNEDHYVFGLYGALTSGSKYGFDYDAETDTIDLTFKVKATTDINDDIMKLKGHADHGLSVIVHLEWMGSDGLVTQDYIYTDEMVQACAGKNLYTFSIRVGERTDMRIAVKVVSDTGATLSSAEYVHS